MGKIPFASGTFGTLSGVPFVLLFLVIPSSFHAIYVTIFILAAVSVADQIEKKMKQKDPECIVIDEMAGYLVAMSVVPIKLVTLVSGFFIFRFFDIIKVPPVRYFEKDFSGGSGVVLDDIMAGIFSALVLRAMYLSGLF